ncbi:hypothetical protein HA402_007372 [Bradysia odoriphaga]|nr:hypothetical protein HA402_007372 [Bradysia odoriphaga]
MTATTNPLLQPSALPYGLPDYAQIRAEHYLPAFEAAFAEHLGEIRAITVVRSMPTFENTIEALERSGELLDRVAHAFYTVSSADATDEIQAVDEKLAPLMAAHEDAITLDGALYWRVQQLHDRIDELGLDAEQRYLLQRRFREMTHAGAALDDAAKARLTALNQQLSTLSNTFERNLLGDTNDLAVVFDSAEELDGLSSGELSATARAASDRGLDGKFLVGLPLFSGHPYLAQLRDRESRRRIMAASLSRGTRDNEFDNRPVLTELVTLRAERAALLGYRSHAAYVTADETAGTPEAVERMLGELAAPSARNARAERDALQAIVDETEAAPFAIEAHDWAFYTEKVRAAKYDIDTSALRPWFEAERVLQDGVFSAATKLYGVTFTERTDLGSYHPGARTFEVFNEDGSALGLYVLDLYTRDSKRGGAWMNAIVNQSRLRGTAPVVVNNLNVAQPGDGEPTLLTLDEVNTLFHEFGHALHGLFAVTYPHFAGTNVFRDFVEFPSQVNEMWILWPEVLDNYARHHETGEPLDAGIVERLRATETFDQGHATSEYLAAAWLDQAWHGIATDAEIVDVAAFEAAALADIGLNDPVVPTRYSSGYFAHVFSGGYSAGYYSYIWSEVLDADTVDWFRENGGLTRDNGDRFRERLLGVGGSKDPLEAYRDFRGRDADIEPLLKRRGLDG